jgi:hypothetical protein
VRQVSGNTGLRLPQWQNDSAVILFQWAFLPLSKILSAGQIEPANAPEWGFDEYDRAQIARRRGENCQALTLA